MAFDIEASIAFWDSVDIDERRIEQIYAMLINGFSKDKARLEGDEIKVWDHIAQSMKENPIPEGSTYEIPSWN